MVGERACLTVVVWDFQRVVPKAELMDALSVVMTVVCLGGLRVGCLDVHWAEK